ncbi:MAG: DUF3800 domain-containing protein [Candidatus Peribacteraceae bacterium]|nr:DUF3800 domain-containing protein [Candidatus Peribacteraceae bacterium]
MMVKKQQFYCYVDETGQDVRSGVFIVAAVVSAEEQANLRRRLEAVEQETGIGERKWHKASHERRMRFLETAFERGIAKNSVFFGTYRKPLPYFLPMLDTVAKAIKAKANGEYQTRVYVDGIDRKKAKELTNALRMEGVSLVMVKGKRDESEPLIRFADRWAGCSRASLEGNAEAKLLVKEAKRTGYLREIEHA